jgi:uncharacterized protein
MSDKHRHLLAERIADYVQNEGLREIAVVFHGGEPLLAGAERIVETANWIRSALPSSCQVSFSLQTNGVFIDKASLDLFVAEDIGISLSIDGPEQVNNLHRLDHQGKPSFKAVEASLELLKTYPQIYAGLIAVIDASVKPEELFEFFNSHQPPRLDFLLPDANYLRLPPGRESNSDLYVHWLIQAFDLWFDKYSHLSIRSFDAILNALAGLPSETDAFGFGDVSLLNIETDGTYHDLDVLKITSEGLTSLGIGLENASIADAAASQQLLEHRKLLCRENLAAECQSCSIVKICGGGSVPHRYAQNGFINPTVYCREMFALISHARKRFTQQLDDEIKTQHTSLKIANFTGVDIVAFESSLTSSSSIKELLGLWTVDARCKFEDVLASVLKKEPEKHHLINRIYSYKSEILNRLLICPSVVLWTAVMQQAFLGSRICSIDDELITPDTNYLETIVSELLKPLTQDVPYIHRDDIWLRLPFGKRIVFESSEVVRIGTMIMRESLNLIESWRPSLLAEIREISPEIQFIKDLTAHPDKVVSFSDNSVPGALYVSIRQGSKYIDKYDLADSLIHEHRHQKLYLLQRSVPLVELDAPLVPSPWREDLRPPSGLLHAIFVFTQLLEFWVYLHTEGPYEIKIRAKNQIEIIRERLFIAIPTLKNTRLTPAGRELLKQLECIALNVEAIGV